MLRGKFFKRVKQVRTKPKPTHYNGLLDHNHPETPLRVTRMTIEEVDPRSLIKSRGKSPEFQEEET
jgi:hypothetical protein